jgi:hypothetical protein
MGFMARLLLLALAAFVALFTVWVLLTPFMPPELIQLFLPVHHALWLPLWLPACLVAASVAYVGHLIVVAGMRAA